MLRLTGLGLTVALMLVCGCTSVNTMEDFVATSELEFTITGENNEPVNIPGFPTTVRTVRYTGPIDLNAIEFASIEDREKWEQLAAIGFPDEYVCYDRYAVVAVNGCPLDVQRVLNTLR